MSICLFTPFRPIKHGSICSFSSKGVKRPFCVGIFGREDVLVYEVAVHLDFPSASERERGESLWARFSQHDTTKYKGEHLPGISPKEPSKTVHQK